MTLFKKFYGLLQETFISDRHFWKCCRIQNQHAKISYLLYTNKKLKNKLRKIKYPIPNKLNFIKNKRKQGLSPRQ